MSVLDQIIARKYQKVEERKSFHPAALLEKSSFFGEKTLSLKEHLLKEGSLGIISEFKRKSPSAGLINGTAKASDVCRDYILAGASAVSVLTDSEFFGGSSEDLTEVRNKIQCPVLRKDFIVDEYQIIESKSIGADAILLIAEVHDRKKLSQLHRIAKSLGLEVLFEVHDKANISRIPGDAEIIGINSRNLASFEVNLDHLELIVSLLPENTIKVAESGIKSVSDYMSLRNKGFNAFLMGEYFMKTADPGKTCREFIDVLRKELFSQRSSDQNKLL
jgi:indole-3-glycerol phosphate synthase